METITKRCYKCDSIKPITDFGHDSSRYDGHSSRCKRCENIRLSIRNRKDTSGSYKLKCKRHYEKHRESISAYHKEYRRKYKNRYTARRLAERAVYNGELTRPLKCENDLSDCGIKIVGHHDNYSKPLEVRWLCVRCHRKFHYNNVVL